MSGYQNSVKAVVNLNNLKNNLAVIKSHIKDSTRIAAVVKADAYGHGAVMVAKAALSAGASMLAVATVSEGVELREAGIDAPVLVLSRGGHYENAIKYNLTETVFSENEALKINEEAKNQGKVAQIHIKFNTGMSRLGFDSFDKSSLNKIERINRLSNVSITGCFTHYATSDILSQKEFAALQYERFKEITELSEKKGMHFQIKHICNSGGIFNLSESASDMVRAGIAMYGCNPDDSGKDYGLKPVMELKSVIIDIRTLKPGESVSYGRHFSSDEDRRIAVIGAGYADGYNRRLSGKADVLICGKRAPVRGNVCMDVFMADVTDIPEAEVGCEVTLIGKDGKEIITADELANLSGTISYEILTSITKRVPREYIG